MNQVKKTRMRMKKEECENKNTRTINKKKRKENDRRLRKVSQGVFQVGYSSSSSSNDYRWRKVRRQVRKAIKEE